MSVVFRELIDRFLEGIPDPFEKYTREGAIRGMVDNGVLYSYRIPLVITAPQGYIINVCRYAMMSSRDLKEAIKALRSIQKLKFYVDLELLFEAMFGWRISSYLRRYNLGALIQAVRHRIDFIDSEIDRKGDIIQGNYYLIKTTIPYDREKEYEMKEERYLYAYFPLKQDRRSINQMFICELPYAAYTLNQARETLKPDEIKKLKEGEYQRQGDLFFYPISKNQFDAMSFNSLFRNRRLKKHFWPIWPTAEIRRRMYGSHAFKHAFIFLDTGSLSFEAAKEVSAAVKIFVKGTVYHRQHGRMRLGNGNEWHVAVKNTALRSWGATSYD